MKEKETIHQKLIWRRESWFERAKNYNLKRKSKRLEQKLYSEDLEEENLNVYKNYNKHYRNKTALLLILGFLVLGLVIYYHIFSKEYFALGLICLSIILKIRNRKSN